MGLFANMDIVERSFLLSMFANDPCTRQETIKHYREIAPYECDCGLKAWEKAEVGK